MTTKEIEIWNISNNNILDVSIFSWQKNYGRVLILFYICIQFIFILHIRMYDNLQSICFVFIACKFIHGNIWNWIGQLFIGYQSRHHSLYCFRDDLSDISAAHKFKLQHYGIYIKMLDQKYMLCLVNVFFYDQLSLLKQFPEKVIHIVLDLLKPFWIILLKEKKTITLNLWITVLLLAPLISVRPWKIIVSRHPWHYESNGLSYSIPWIHHFRSTLDLIVRFGTLIRQI